MVSTIDFNRVDAFTRDPSGRFASSESAGVESLQEIVPRYLLARGWQLPTRLSSGSRRESDAETRFASKT